MEVAGRVTEINENECSKDNVLCEPCQRGKTTGSANGVCRNCKEYMCLSCFGHHLKAKICSSHVLVEISQYMQHNTELDVEVCTNHDDERVKFFCRKHEVVGCGDCMILEHSACKPEYIKALSKDFKSEETFTETITKLNGLEVDAINTYEFVDTHRRETTLHLQKALEDIKSFRTDMNEYLDRAEEKINAEANKLNSENEMRIEKLEELIKSIQTDIKELKKNLCEDIHRDAVLFINLIRNKSKLDNVEKSLKIAKSEHLMTRFNFEADQTLTRLVSAEQQLGRFDMVSSNILQVDPDSKTSSSQRRSKWRKSDLKPSMFRPGIRVQRGPDWNAGDSDGNGLGTITTVYKDHSVFVIWDHRKYYKHACCAGTNGRFDVKPV